MFSLSSSSSSSSPPPSLSHSYLGWSSSVSDDLSLLFPPFGQVISLPLNEYFPSSSHSIVISSAIESFSFISLKKESISTPSSSCRILYTFTIPHLHIPSESPSSSSSYITYLYLSLSPLISSPNHKNIILFVGMSNGSVFSYSVNTIILMEILNNPNENQSEREQTEGEVDGEASSPFSPFPSPVTHIGSFIGPSPLSSSFGINNLGVTCLISHENSLLVGLYDGSILLWDNETFMGKEKWRGHSKRITNIHILPHGQTTHNHSHSSFHCISSSLDGNLRLWEISSNGFSPSICVSVIPLDFPITSTHLSHRFPIDNSPCYFLSVGGSNGQLVIFRININILSQMELENSNDKMKNKNLDLSDSPSISDELIALEVSLTSADIRKSEESVNSLSSAAAIHSLHFTPPSSSSSSLSSSLSSSPSSSYFYLFSFRHRDIFVYQLKLKLSLNSPSTLKCTPFPPLRLRSKIVSASFHFSSRTLFLSLVDNSGGIVKFTPKNKLLSSPSSSPPPSLFTLLSLWNYFDNFGFRFPIRFVFYHSVNNSIVAADKSHVGIFDLKRNVLIKKFQCVEGNPNENSNGNFIQSVWVTFHSKWGKHFVVIGTSKGNLQLWDMMNNECCDVVSGHSGNVWTINAMRNTMGVEMDSDSEIPKQFDQNSLTFASGGADHKVNLWEIIPGSPSENLNENSPSPQFSFFLLKTLQLSSVVLSICYSPDNRYLIACLMDSTVKIFYSDSLKYFLTLYGHKLPVTCADVSSSPSSSIIATGSADKSIKVFGIEFGDCQKSFFAHDDIVTAVQFLPKTFYLFSISKDRSLKLWDCEKFHLIQKFNNFHEGEVWGLHVAIKGNFIITAGADRRIRITKQKNNFIFVGENEEKEQIKNIMETKENKREQSHNDKVITGFLSRSPAQTEEMLHISEIFQMKLSMVTEEIHRREREGNDPNVSHPILGFNDPIDFFFDFLMKTSLREIENSIVTIQQNQIPMLMDLVERKISQRKDNERMSSLSIPPYSLFDILEFGVRLLSLLVSFHFHWILSLPKTHDLVRKIHRIHHQLLTANNALKVSAKHSESRVGNTNQQRQRERNE